MRARRASSSNGFTRKANAPAARAAARIPGCSRPVMTITRVPGETSRKRCCTARPLASGSHTSSTASVIWYRAACARKSSARSKVCAESPSESSRRSIERRTEASSSRTQNGLVGFSHNGLPGVTGITLRPTRERRYSTLGLHGNFPLGPLPATLSSTSSSTLSDRIFREDGGTKWETNWIRTCAGQGT